MSEEDARSFGLPENRKARSRYARLDDAKQNYAGIDDAQWIEKVVCVLANGEFWCRPLCHGKYPYLAIPITTANAILDEGAAGIDDGSGAIPTPRASRPTEPHGALSSATFRH